MKMKLRFFLLLLSFIILFTAVDNISYAINLPNRLIYFSESGQDVKEIQLALNAVGYNLNPDGLYGPRTKATIVDFQRSHSLAIDGNYGESTRTELLKALENNIVPEVSNPGKQNKVAYLTFDDGPSKTITPKILKILKNYGIEATFFVLGSMAEKSPELIKQIKEDGHSIGNHSYSHKYKFIYNKVDNFLNEIEATDQILKGILGEDFSTSLLRFPGGSFGNKRKIFREAAKEKGYRIYDWNALSGDTEARNVPKDKLITNLKKTENNVKNKDLIVLNHDGYEKETTVEALPAIIDYLINKGYIFKKLEQ